MDDRIRNLHALSKLTTPDEAALLIKDGMTVGTSGFTMAGYPKAVPLALARRAEAGEDIKITLITGASVGDELDGALARAGVIGRRYPYQTNDAIRERINLGDIAYVDMHLSQVPFYIKQGYFGKIDVAIVEAVAIDEMGNIIPSASLGCSNVLMEYADKVIVEINTTQSMGLAGYHDVYSPKPIPHTEPISITKTGDRIGTPYISCPSDKLAAVVYCDIPDGTRPIPPIDDGSRKMAGHLLNFLKSEMAAGRLPDPLPPLQSGVGAVANAVLSGFIESDFNHLSLYSEVLQDSVLDLIDAGKVDFASGTALTLSPDKLLLFYKNIEQYRSKIVLRPQEISNSPEVVRRLGAIAVNTALEADLSGNINSTHLNGTYIMNGLGGSGDFTRNALISIFTTLSTAKNGTLSCIVPTVSHVDHTEHDVDILITERGIADLRGLTAYERAEKIIKNCAHPGFKDDLQAYIHYAHACSTGLHGIAPMLSTVLQKRA
jgi:succinyl-CoA:acetate CoA-transferase